MRDVAIVSFAQHAARREDTRNEVEILLPVVREALGAVGLKTHDMGFTCCGSTDYLAGQAFAFVSALDAVGPWPPISESHVEMDGAFALYEAWVRLQHGDIDTALVYSFGKSSPGDVARVLSLQLDPYLLGPLWPDAGQPRGAAGAGPARRRARRARRTSPGSSPAAAATRRATRTPSCRATSTRRRCSTSRSTPTRCASTTCPPSATARP